MFPSNLRPATKPACVRCLALACSVGFFLGCSGDRIAVPKVSPQEASRQAMAEYDANSDGVLDNKELERCPALKDCWKNLNRGGQARLTAQDIADRLAAHQASNVGLMTVPCRVYLDRKPLEGATVRLVPEKFLGRDFKPASGVTDANGRAVLQTAGAKVPGVQCGFFRVEVSKKDGSGAETLAPRYNNETVLGVEIAPDSSRQSASVRLDLTSR
jgi:hypothetical protein